MTVVEGKVPSSRAKEFEMSYAEVKDNKLPDALVQSFLLKDTENPEVYRIATVWKSSEGLEEFRESMKKTKQTPTAVALFQKVGVEPTFKVYNIPHRVR